jgi:2-dehydropantoate 2-reductase
VKIAVVGAGGVGGYFGAALSRAGHEVRLLARGEHLAAIRAGGLHVKDPAGEWTASIMATDDPAELSPAELAIVAVKSYSLAEVAGILRGLAQTGAVVLPLLNGVETFETLVRLGVPPASVLCGLAEISVDRTSPGLITRRSDFRRIVVGEHSGGASPRSERIAAILRDSGADVRVSENVDIDLWAKLVLMGTIAAVCGLARADIGAVRDAPLGRKLFERAAGEITAVARARGISLRDGEERRVLERVTALPAGFKPSLLLDLERGGRNELDALSGAVSRFGAESGVPTPIHDTATAAFSAASRMAAVRPAKAGPA